MRLGGGDVILWPGSILFEQCTHRCEVPDVRVDEMRTKMAMVTMITVSGTHQTNIPCPLLRAKLSTGTREAFADEWQGDEVRRGCI